MEETETYYLNINIEGEKTKQRFIDYFFQKFGNELCIVHIKNKEKPVYLITERKDIFELAKKSMPSSKEIALNDISPYYHYETVGDGDMFFPI